MFFNTKERCFPTNVIFVTLNMRCSLYYIKCCRVYQFFDVNNLYLINFLRKYLILFLLILYFLLNLRHFLTECTGILFVFLYRNKYPKGITIKICNNIYIVFLDFYLDKHCRFTIRN